MEAIFSCRVMQRQYSGAVVETVQDPVFFNEKGPRRKG